MYLHSFLLGFEQGISWAKVLLLQEGAGQSQLGLDAANDSTADMPGPQLLLCGPDTLVAGTMALHAEL